MNIKRFCTSCGKELAADTAFCDNCGTPVKDADTPPPSGRGRRFYLVAGAATVAMVLAIGGVWWGLTRAPQPSQADGAARPGAVPTPDKATPPASPSTATIAGQPGAPGDEP